MHGVCSVPLSCPQPVTVPGLFLWGRDEAGDQHQAGWWGKQTPRAHPARLCPQGGCGKLSVSTIAWKFWGNFNLAVGCEKPRGFTALLCQAVKSWGATLPGELSLESQLGRGRIVTPWNVLSHLLRLRAVPFDEIQGSGDSGEIGFQGGQWFGVFRKSTSS